MPAPEPARSLDVALFGAGLSSAFRLPNTPSLLGEIRPFVSLEVLTSLERAYKFLYPDAVYDHYQPDVVDFFSALSTFVDLGTGWPGTLLPNARELQRSLKRAIAHMLIDKARRIDEKTLKSHSFLSRVLVPGSVVITTNWDMLVERYAELNSIPLRLSSTSNKFPSTSITLLKLHGSVDWCRSGSATKPYRDSDYASLTELRFPARPYTPGLPPEESDELVRVRTKWSSAWQTVSSRSREPWIVTMVTGKQDDLGPLQRVWRDAYSALGRARSLEIVGYSMPPDDVEVRTLLRAGMQRGSEQPTITIRNPAPEAHARFRNLISHTIASDYSGVPGL